MLEEYTQTFKLCNSDKNLYTDQGNYSPNAP